VSIYITYSLLLFVTVLDFKEKIYFFTDHTMGGSGYSPGQSRNGRT
jgi:hypothetical protein